MVAIHHLAADLLLQVEHLRGRDLVVDENRSPPRVLPASRRSSSRLAGAEIRRLVEPGALFA